MFDTIRLYQLESEHFCALKSRKIMVNNSNISSYALHGKR